MIRHRLIQHLRAQNWTAVFIELVIVVVGILLALQITEWNDARHDRARERDYLVRIDADLEQSIRDIGYSIDTALERQQFGVLLMQAVDNPDVVRAEPGRFMLALQKGAYTFSPEIRAHTFEELKSVGDLGLIRDKALLTEITEFYSDVRQWSQWNYLRSANQTESIRRGAGILTYAQIQATGQAKAPPDFTVEEAMAARERMLARPHFVEWLPVVSYREDDLNAYRSWLARAEQVRARIQALLAEDAF